MRIIRMLIALLLPVFAGEPAFCMDVNILIATRNSRIPSYAELNKGEVYLVFAKLASAIPGNNIKNVEKVIEEKFKDSSPGNIIKEQVLSVFRSEQEVMDIDAGKPTLILFNEMFFGRDYALKRESVDSIVNCYRDFAEFFANVYLYIDFLYKDKMCIDYTKQVEVSQKRYQQIRSLEAENATFTGFSSIWFRQLGPPNYTGFNKGYLDLVLSNGVDSDVFGGTLLFNQIKIFFNGKELGFYNKSSFCSESLFDFVEQIPSTFLAEIRLKRKVPFYMIGDFTINWLKDHDPLLDDITSLICYDTDAILNLEDQPSKKQVCLFASNTYDTLLASIYDRKERKGIFDHIYICSDPKGKAPCNMESLNSKTIGAYQFAITGAFSTDAENFIPLKSVPLLKMQEFKFPKEMPTNSYRIYGFKI